ncbi:MAG: putative phage tail protein [Bdellovibrionota bacterium]
MAVIRRHLQADYGALLLALLPRGRAWPRDATSNLAKLLFALGAELARVEGRVHDLISEAFPSTVEELIDEWEKEYGLPDPCTEPPSTLDERIEVLLANLFGNADGTPAFWTGIASALGYNITITTPPPFTCESECDDFYYADDAAGFNWIVSTASQGASKDALLECLFEHYQPSHGLFSFEYS